MRLTTSWTMKKARKVFIIPQHMLSSFNIPNEGEHCFINLEKKDWTPCDKCVLF